jgi:hypothetical protein
MRWGQYGLERQAEGGAGGGQRIPLAVPKYKDDFARSFSHPICTQKFS